MNLLLSVETNCMSTIKITLLVHKKATKIQINEYPKCTMQMKLKYV